MIHLLHPHRSCDGHMIHLLHPHPHRSCDGHMIHLLHPHPHRSDTSEDELEDQDIQKILIVIQTPPAVRKHPGGDRTGNFTTRNKMTSDIAQAINDGLYFYEQVRVRVRVRVRVCVRGACACVCVCVCVCACVFH